MWWRAHPPPSILVNLHCGALAVTTGKRCYFLMYFGVVCPFVGNSTCYVHPPVLWIAVLWTVSPSLVCVKFFVSFGLYLCLFSDGKKHENTVSLGYLHTRWFSVHDTHYYYYYYYDFRCFLRTCSLAHFTIPPPLPHFNGVHIFNSGFASFLALLFLHLTNLWLFVIILTQYIMEIQKSVVLGHFITYFDSSEE